MLKTLESKKDKDKRVLVVDDDEGILDAISFVLEDAGYNYETTPKGDETFEKVKKFKPDVILLDMLLSGNDGRIICQQLKSDKETQQIPVIMISAHPSAERSIEKCGANAFLPKPFEANDLLTIIDKHTS
jgi:DNA-binding response OmpR family regulator